jgi:hypothetical protein
MFLKTGGWDALRAMGWCRLKQRQNRQSAHDEAGRCTMPDAADVESKCMLGQAKQKLNAAAKSRSQKWKPS